MPRLQNGKPIYIDLTEFIGTAMKASLLVGLFASLPFVLYHIVMFVAPGLTLRERTVPVRSHAREPAGVRWRVRRSATSSSFPPMVDFLLNFGGDIATAQIRISSYISLMLTLLFWMGIVFETPIVLFFLSKIGIVTPEFLARQRRYAVVAAFILGAAITPTFDPINQSLVAVPIIVLYEVGIWLAKLGRLGRKRKTVPEV